MHTICIQSDPPQVAMVGPGTVARDDLGGNFYVFDPARGRRKLTMTATSCDQVPPVVVQETQQLTHFHPPTLELAPSFENVQILRESGDWPPDACNQRRRAAASAALPCWAAVAVHGLIFRSTGVNSRSATSVSCATWARNQYPLQRPRKRHRRRSVSAVMARLPATISLIRCAGTPISLASASPDFDSTWIHGGDFR